MKKLLILIPLITTLCSAQCPQATKVLCEPVYLTNGSQDCCHGLVSQVGIPVSTLYTVQLTNEYTKNVTTFTGTTNSVFVEVLQKTNYTIKAGYLCNGTTIWSKDIWWGTGPELNPGTCTTTIDVAKVGMPVTTQTTVTMNIPAYIGQSVDVILLNLKTNIQLVTPNVKGNSCTVTGLTNNTWYVGRMQMKCTDGTYGVNSGPIMFKTKY